MNCFFQIVSDMQSQGLAVDLIIDRATAARFGITPASVDNALYDAFGQRQINTLYTQVNQYHVILETDPRFQSNPRKLDDLYIHVIERNVDPKVSGQSRGLPAFQKIAEAIAQRFG